MKLLFISTLVVLTSILHYAVRPAAEPVLIGSGKMPAVTVDKKNQAVHVVFGLGDSLLYSYSADKGRTFAAPQLIQTIKGLNASFTRGPEVSVTKTGVCVVATTEDGKIHSWNMDSHRVWRKTAMVSDTDSVALEGFVSLAGDDQDNLVAVWLDMRGDKMNKVYGSTSHDGGTTWEENKLIYASPDSTVCECCKPSVDMRDNRVYVMFRNWLNGNRDMYLAKSDNGGKTFSTPQQLGQGHWPLKGCPMDGGGIAINDQGAVTTIWRREQNLYTCQPGSAEALVGEGRGATIEAFDKGFAYAWTQKGEIICKLPGDETRNLGKGSSIRLQAVDKNNLLCVWENNGQIRSLLVSK